MEAHELVDRVHALNDGWEAFAAIIKAETPAGRLQALALTNAEQAFLWAARALETDFPAKKA